MSNVSHAANWASESRADNVALAPRISEDWLSLIIGLLIFALALAGLANVNLLGWVVTTSVWTNLGQALQNADANTIILMGLWTNYVVEATARHASDMGYRVFLVREACASNTIENHEFTINKILPTLCYVVSVKDTLAALE